MKPRNQRSAEVAEAELGQGRQSPRRDGGSRHHIAADPAQAQHGGFVICPLCGDPERPEDIVGGVCLTCADAITFAHNARRGSIVVPTGGD